MVKLDETGVHDRDCACARCEAGFRPSYRERADARRVFEERKRRAAAAGAAPPAGREAVKAAAARESIATDVRNTDARLARLRAAYRSDPRMELYLQLVREGKTREEAEAEVEARFILAPTPTEGTEDDHEDT